jgi:outer membrane protein OmpA-like peptidoglycan-associated protein
MTGPFIKNHVWIVHGVAIALGLLTAQEALGQEGLSYLGITSVEATQVGGRQPALILRPSVALRKVSVTMRPTDGGRIIRLRTGRMRAGSRRVLGWKQAIGEKQWEATLSVVFGTGKKATYQLNFKTTVYPKIVSTIAKKDVNLAKHYLIARLNQPAGKVDLKVFGDNGKVIHNETTEFFGEKPGTPLRVQWSQPAGIRVLKREIRAWSSFGFWVGTELTPFEVSIPHDDVEFGFGHWHIAEKQAPKLHKTMKLLAGKLRRYGHLVKLQLYVAGYTDTVGSKSSNRVLSEKRARSIASYFRKLGLRIPIYYQGFGEVVPAVATPDETREPRNRRAVYVLSAGPPGVQRAMPRANWKHIK